MVSELGGRSSSLSPHHAPAPHMHSTLNIVQGKQKLKVYGIADGRQPWLVYLTRIRHTLKRNLSKFLYVDGTPSRLKACELLKKSF